MSDYLNLGMEEQPAQGDFLGTPDFTGGDAGYLGMDDAPANPPMPSADPFGNTTGGYDGGGYEGGFLESAPAGGYLADEVAPASIDFGAPLPAPADELSVQAPYLEEVQPGRAAYATAPSDLSSLVLDVEVPVEVYFGDASLTVEAFLELGAGSVVELDHSIEMPIELRVRGKLVARGQLVTVNGNYGLRVTDMVEQQS